MVRQVDAVSMSHTIKRLLTLATLSHYKPTVCLHFHGDPVSIDFLLSILMGHFVLHGIFPVLNSFEQNFFRRIRTPASHRGFICFILFSCSR